MEPTTNQLWEVKSKWTWQEAFDAGFYRAKNTGRRFLVKKENGVWRVYRLNRRWCEERSQVHKL